METTVTIRRRWHPHLEGVAAAWSVEINGQGGSVSLHAANEADAFDAANKIFVVIRDYGTAPLHPHIKTDFGEA